MVHHQKMQSERQAKLLQEKHNDVFEAFRKYEEQQHSEDELISCIKVNRKIKHLHNITTNYPVCDSLMGVFLRVSGSFQQEASWSFCAPTDPARSALATSCGL